MASTHTTSSPSVCPAELYIAGLGTPKSRQTATCALRTLEGAFGVSPIDWGALTFVDIARARAHLTSYSPGWGSACLSVLRSILRTAERLDIVDASLVADAVALPAIRGTSGRLGRDVDDAEIAALVAAVDSTTTKGLRDGAVLALLLGGLRCAETTRVEVGDFDPATGRLIVRAGKGRKHRLVPLGRISQRLLSDFLAEHPGSGPVLRSVDRWGRIGSSLSPRGVQAALASLCDAAGIPSLSPHALRAHRITAVISHGDVFLAQRYAGHADVSVTQRYDRRELAALEAVVAAIPEPITRPRLVA